MLFFLSAAEYNNVQNNTTKVKVHLNGGIAEILEQHQDLMGRIDNNIIEIETFFENRVEKLLFILQDAVFVVSNKGLDSKEEEKGTFVAVLGDKSREITESVTAASIASEIERSKASITNETALYNAMIGQPVAVSINSKIYLLQQELSFLERMSFIVEDMRKDKRS